MSLGLFLSLQELKKYRELLNEHPCVKCVLVATAVSCVASLLLGHLVPGSKFSSPEGYGADALLGRQHSIKQMNSEDACAGVRLPRRHYMGAPLHVTLPHI